MGQILSEDKVKLEERPLIAERNKFTAANYNEVKEAVNDNHERIVQLENAPGGVTILDEDDMVSDSDTAVPTQQSVKTYVDNKVANAGTGAPSKYQFIFESNLSQNFYEVILVAAGTQFSEEVQFGSGVSYRVSNDGTIPSTDQATLGDLNTYSAGLTGGTFFSLSVGLSTITNDQAIVELTEL